MALPLSSLRTLVVTMLVSIQPTLSPEVGKLQPTRIIVFVLAMTFVVMAPKTLVALSLTKRRDATPKMAYASTTWTLKQSAVQGTGTIFVIMVQ
jgi:hypothetical protein